MTFRDEQWNQVIFHGVNVIYRNKPYLPKLDGDDDPHLSLNKRDIKELKSWGFNFVRIAVPWEAVEVEAPGSTFDNLRTMYNETYLEQIDELILMLA